MKIILKIWSTFMMSAGMTCTFSHEARSQQLQWASAAHLHQQTKKSDFNKKTNFSSFFVVFNLIFWDLRWNIKITKNKKSWMNVILNLRSCIFICFDSYLTQSIDKSSSDRWKIDSIKVGFFDRKKSKLLHHAVVKSIAAERKRTF